MSILFREKEKTFTLQTAHSSYQMKIGDYGYLFHVYYGARVEDPDLSWLVTSIDRGFAGNPNEAGDRRSFSLDILPQEYPSFGTGDFRDGCLTAVHPDGSRAADLRYSSHRIFDGKPGLSGLPAVYATETEAQTLEITLRDSASALEVVLRYSVLEEYDAITRSAEIVNRTDGSIRLESALSCCVDFPNPRPMELLTFYGRHSYERAVERSSLRHGKLRVDSIRGASSHQQNPFVILCEPGADEEQGECFGFSFVYSGNFLAQAELDQIGQARFLMGINPDGFLWTLEKEESFTAPEVILCYSGEGLGGLSRKLHRLLREHVCRGEYKDKPRPILINNWEATYFQFNGEKLFSIAREVSSLGVDLLVIDDGWFGKREDDRSGLGDWSVNLEKLAGGLAPLCEKINALGMKLGLWFEPEMVSEDSGLYRSHPDWCLRIPGRAPIRSRFQLVLDMSRPDVRDYLFESICAVLESANLEYVKWDMNRHLTDVWSSLLPAGRQGELYHRYVLGVYNLLERLISAFPHILFEGCSGGGGRFDAGALYYTPQIWCSDNTDAADRIDIQYGTSFGYPIAAVGSHVSACPNHQTGRVTPFHTRGVVAMSGTFGYELDPSKLSPEEKAEIREQTAFYRAHYPLIAWGDYYRLTNPFENRDHAAWMFASPNGREALLNFVLLRARSNPPQIALRLRGLDPALSYRINGGEQVYSGAALMRAGFILPELYGDYTALQFDIKAV